jgi:hypothetical protein
MLVAIITTQITIITVIVTEKTMTHKTSVTSNTEKFTDDIWMCDSGACGHYCISDKVLFDVKDINESIKVGNGDIMMATKVGSL